MDTQTASTPNVGELLRSLRLEVRKQHLSRPGALTDWELPDWTHLRAHLPVLHQHVDLIGRVNPRYPAWYNPAIQFGKAVVARLLEWRVRAQRVFNQAAAACITNLVAAGERYDRILERIRTELRTLVDTQEQQTGRMNEELTRLGAALQQLQEQFAQEQEKRRQLERPAEQFFDYFAFEQQMRGDEESVRRRQAAYLDEFRGQVPVVDLGCGRGEFLELLRAEGIEARGVDRHPQMVTHCQARGLTVTQGDLLDYLNQQPAGSLGGIFCAQVVEHLRFPELAHLLRLSFSKLRPGGLAAFETQNPECLLSMGRYFWIDPTHRHPIHPQQLVFLLQRAGFREVQVRWLNPCPPEHHLPKLTPPRGKAGEYAAFNAGIDLFNQTFFGAMDYAVLGRK
jgi:O-antigen chain-terminating methyltransferase